MARTNSMTESRTTAVYAFVSAYIQEQGYAPSLREIAAACGIGMGTALRHLDRLEARGQITRVSHQPRSISLLN